MTDDVLTEVAPLTYRTLPLAQVIAAGGTRHGTKRWPTGLREPLWVLPASQRRGKDDGQRGIGGARVVLTERDRKSLERQIGVPIRDAQQARREMKKRGLHFAEKGEAVNDTIDAQIEYAESRGRERGLPSPTKFPGWDTLGLMPTPKPFDHARVLAENCRRYGLPVPQGD